MTIMTHFEKKMVGRGFYFFLKMRWQLNRFFFAHTHDELQFCNYTVNIKKKLPTERFSIHSI